MVEMSASKLELVDRVAGRIRRIEGIASSRNRDRAVNPHGEIWL